MAISDIFYAMRDKNNAANDALNLDPGQVVSLQFVSGPSGDLFLEQEPDDGDADSFPNFDPDTQVILNDGTPANFSVLLVGTLPVSGKVPDPLEGKTVILIKIDVNGDGILNANDPQYFFVADGSGTLTLMSNGWGGGSLTLLAVDETPPPDPVCFRAGSAIATPSGPRAVETLRPGDMVLTEDGRAVQLVWVGCSHYSAAQLAADPALRPIRIPAHAIRRGMPDRDLDLSPQHRIVIDGAACELMFGQPRVLVVAKHLVGTLAQVVEDDAGVTYFHLLFEEHEILLSNGLPSESFQPARRMIEQMAGGAQTALMATLDALGADAILTRPDALPTLRSLEARVLLESLVQTTPTLARQGSAQTRALH
ncbi:Hint domain-containing protein [Tabrizicola aquatica]|uniref:Hint domain-containing protein n=1 Tax=Tabrizicola aquatica TaxID=909926 RepID=UPI000CD19337|nr:Hint domain-containing protein [Tabrizicola aquatica]